MCPPAQLQNGMTIRCVVVHDLVLLRQGLRRLLEDEPDLEVVAEAGNATDALNQISALQPNVVIADTRIFGGTADQAEQGILQASASSKVVFLAPHKQDGVPWPGAGANYVMRQTPAHEFLALVRKTAAAERIAPRNRVSEFPIDEFTSRRRVLTAREREVLKLLAEGRTVRSVADVLGLSAKTVDAHKFNLMRKLGIHNKAELVMWAIQKRVVKLPVNF